MPASPTCQPRIAFLASPVAHAQTARARLVARYQNARVDDADVLCVLGGDGFMLQMLHRYGGRNGRPVFGMRMGSVGFLMNAFEETNLPARLAKALPAVLNPLHVTVTTDCGACQILRAYNEVALLRQTRQTAHLAIELNGQQQIACLVGDGILVATPAGSTAYNYSAHGPILPLRSRTLALTPLAVYRPRRWRGAILHAETQMRVTILDSSKRPVSVTADSHEIRHAVEVRVHQTQDHSVTLLFDDEHGLEERIFNEQFAF